MRVWQTYKTDESELPPYARRAMGTWRKHGHEINYLSDDDIRDWLLTEWDAGTLDLWESLPVGVMRADMWRYLVIYTHGGAYADLDTECYDAIDNWLPAEFSSGSKELVVCPENDVHYCQWFFVGRAGGSLLGSVIDLMFQRLHNPDYSMDNLVHYHTGPGVFTGGLMVNDPRPGINPVYDPPPNMLYCFQGENARIFHDIKVRNIFGSLFWNDGRYARWTEEAKEYRGSVTPRE